MPLKKILILSYYYPPCNLTPSERVQAMSVYLNKFGYYPVIVTRNWDIPFKYAVDEHKRSGEKVKHEKYDTHEVYYIPFRPNLKDKLFEKFCGTKWYFLYLIIAFFYNVLENVSSRFTPYLPLYKAAKEILRKGPGFSFLLVSGGPFHLFKFGYLLKKEFNIPWVADYRDDWNTAELFYKGSFFKQLVQKISKRNEIKWVGSSNFFISVSDYYVQKIGKLHTGLPGHTILNGYMPEKYENIRREESNEFRIVYVGSLFPNQRINIFLNAFKRFTETPEGRNAKIFFVGLKEQPANYARVKKIVADFEEHVIFTNRVEKAKAIEIQHNANVLLACAYLNLKGIPGSKLYEYIALKKPVLVCPTDGEIIEETLKETGQGYFANTEEECFKLLCELSNLYRSNKTDAVSIDLSAVNRFSRIENVKKLASLITESLGDIHPGSNK